MSDTGILFNMDQVLSEAEGSVYDPHFGDAYWWGDPELEISHDIDVVKASKAGKRLLELCRTFNGGMLRLRDPEQLEDTLLADLYPRGTIVKTIEESTIRHLGKNPTNPSDALYVASSRDTGFTVAKFLGKQGFATYARNAFWSVSAESKSGELAFFPLLLNRDQSYSAGLDLSYAPCLKVIGSSPNSGSVQLTRGVTTAVSDDDGIMMYGRNIENTIYQPLSLPAKKFFFPGNLNFR